MRVGRTVLAALLLACFAAAVASAEDPDPTTYCVGDGGPLGAATAAEHNVLIGDPKPPAGVRESRISVGGVGTRVIQAGPPDATEAVLFVHGNPGSARDWDALVAANGRFARTVALDIPGWGKSDKAGPPELHTTDGAAAYIQGALEVLGIKRVVLGAHDFGGIWGLQWASQHPRAVRGVVLIDTGVLKDYAPHALAIVWSTPGAGEAQVASTTRTSFHQAVQFMQPRPLPDPFVDRMYDDYDRLTRCALLRYYRSARDATLGDTNAYARKQEAALKPRNLPALVIWGDKDPYIPSAQAYRQREVFPRARVEVFPDSAHWPFVDNAAKTRAAVVPFLRSRLGASVKPARAGQQHVRVAVTVAGMLPAHRVRARLGRDVTKARSVSGTRTLRLTLSRPLRAGRYRIAVRALGLPTRHLRLRVVPEWPRPAPVQYGGGPARFTG